LPDATRPRRQDQSGLKDLLDHKELRTTIETGIATGIGTQIRPDEIRRRHVRVDSITIQMGVASETDAE
jgi:hypothetical protein